ncbi:hypothetical protein [Actomonas aquatica]|uniref:Lipase helper protein n=1 Tax=Actomonas aquatica TaxID=2866162 RepID=A0ABZ1CAI2_9BACT|nr:hypothetical protein [Opitutus sp. WL0086]WRQ88238.1 hypothetical protein K1X11_002390 [Opitutus sp. WL0086]
MKTATVSSAGQSRLGLLLGLSLLANFALVAAVVFRRATPAPPTTPVLAPAAAPTAPESLPALQDEPATPDPFTADAHLWSRLDTTDPAELIQRLRAAGVPEEVVREFVWQRIHFTPENASEVQEAPYWLRRSRSTQAMDRLRAQRDPATGDRPDYALFRELFGASPNQGYSPGWKDVFAASTGMSLAANEKIAELNRAHNQAKQALQNRLRAVRDPAERAALLASLQTQFDDQLRVALSPADYAAYQQRANSGARLLQNRASGVSLTQGEFDVTARALQDLATAPSDLTPYRDSLTSLLGEEKYLALQQATTGDRRTNQLVERLGLSYDTATQIEALQKEINQRAAATIRDASLDAATRAARLEALTTEALEQLDALLPPEGVQAYRQTSGQWIDALTRLNPPPRPRTPNVPTDRQPVNAAPDTRLRAGGNGG